MKAADSLKAKFGSTMRESMGADRQAPGFAPLPTADGGEAAKYEGTARLKLALAIPVDRIVPDPGQPRKSFETLEGEELAQSMKTRGQLQPIRVRWDEAGETWVIVAGERRWRAAKAAGLATIQCVEAKGPMTESEILEDQLVENLLREDLKPVERANAYKALMDRKGLTYRELAHMLHISPGAVSQAISLLKLPEVVKARVDAGEVASTVAYEISKLDNPADQVELASQVASEKMTRADTAYAVKGSQGKKGAKGKGSKAKAKAARPRNLDDAIGDLVSAIRAEWVRWPEGKVDFMVSKLFDLAEELRDSGRVG